MIALPRYSFFCEYVRFVYHIKFKKKVGSKSSGAWMPWVMLYSEDLMYNAGEIISPR